MFVIERNMPEILKQTQVLLNMTKAGKNYSADINEDLLKILKNICMKKNYVKVV